MDGWIAHNSFRFGLLRLCIYFAMIEILAATVVAQTNRLFFLLLRNPRARYQCLRNNWRGDSPREAGSQKIGAIELESARS